MVKVEMLAQDTVSVGNTINPECIESHPEKKSAYMVDVLFI